MENIMKSHSQLKLPIQMIAAGFMALSMVLLLVLNSSHFNIAAIVPNLSADAVALGLALALKAYRAGKGIRAALTVAFSWNVVSLILWVIGDTVIVPLLENNIGFLSKW